MSTSDHTIILLTCLLYPLYSYIDYKSQLKEVLNGSSYKRKKEYYLTSVIQWFLCGLTLYVWNSQNYAWADLGLILHMNIASWVILGLIIFLIFLFYTELKKVGTYDREITKKIYNNIGDLVHIIPHSKSELKPFYFLAFTAGFVEELIYRGFLLWYTTLFLPDWAAILTTILIFGLIHSYQGFVNVIKVTGLSVIFVTMYLLTESLIIPMFFHFIFDVFQGRLCHETILKYEKDKRLISIETSSPL